MKIAEIKDECSCDNNLKNENGWKAVFELWMKRLMAKEFHAGDGANGTADNGYADEGSFRRAPFLGFSFVFVRAVHDKGDEVDDEETAGWNDVEHDKGLLNKVNHVMRGRMNYGRIPKNHQKSS